ncbi:MAG: ArnT family glycosyltransferase [Anaerolineae bacterium]
MHYSSQQRYAITPRVDRRILVALLVLYLILAVQFALGTPLWQVPDEPAHYNYVRYITENWALPELKEGDYSHDYFDTAKRYRFVQMDMTRFRYESHQPPLYYMLMAPVHAAATGLGLNPVYTIRLASAMLGLVALILGYHVVRHVFPDDPRIALGATAFAAVLPMHVTMVAAVNNDVLAELMIAAVALQLVKPASPRWTWQRAALLGATLGLAALTKLQSYVALGLVAGALAWDCLARQEADRRLPLRRALGLGAIVLAIALLVVAPWLLRNAHVYGWNDLLALQRHDQVVEGQLTTTEFIRANGVKALVVSFVQTTFQSFWGQFGWMGVVLHPRFYLGAALLSGVVASGFVAAVLRVTKARRRLDQAKLRGAALLLVWGLITLAGYLWWNVSYVQHQGRYLFPAIVPLGAAFAIGLREVLVGDQRIPYLALGALLLYLIIDGIRWRNLKLFSALMTIGTAGLLAAGKRIEERWPGAAMSVIYLAISVYGMYCLYAYIIPVLSP